MRPSWRSAALCLILLTTTAATRPYLVDDLLKLEGDGPSGLDPSGRWWVMESQRPHEEAAGFTSQGFNAYGLGRPLIVDLQHPAKAKPLLQDAADTAYRVGPFSPGGRFVVVYRSRDLTWEVGVVTLETGAVRWLGVGPEQPFFGAGLRWRTQTELVAIALPPGDLPIYRRRGRLQAQRLPALWAKAVKGVEPTFMVVGSGRFIEDRPPPVAKQLVRIDVVTGKVTPLATGPFNDLELSSSGRYAAVLASAEAFQPDAKLPARQGELEGRRLALNIVDLDNGRVTRPLPQRDVLWSLLRWAPARDDLLVFTRAPGEDWPQGKLQQVQADGRSRDLALDLQPTLDWTPYLMIASLQAGWSGDTPLVRARRRDARASSRADWYALDASGATNLTDQLSGGVTGPYAIVGQDLLVGADQAVWRVDRQGRRVRVAAAARLVLAPQLGATVRDESNPPQSLTGHDLWIETTKGSTRRISRLGDPTATLSSLTEDGRALAVQGKDTIITRVDDHGVQVVELHQPRRPDLALVTLNAHLAQVATPQIHPVVHAGPNGTTLTSWLYLPAAHRAGERLPMIVITYPGIAYTQEPYNGRPDAKTFAESTSVMVGRGYAVLMASYERPSTSREPSEGFTDALIAATDAAVATGLVDGDRVALWGHSFGGYASLIAATRTDRFKAIVAANGIGDLASLMTGFAAHYRIAPEDGLSSAGLFGWGETSQGQLATTPWDDPQRFVRNSPLYHAGKIHTPVLLVTSDMDFLPIDQGEEMFTALWRQGKDAKLLTFFGEGHVVESPANVRAFYDEAFAFLRPLIGEGQPTPELKSISR